MASTEFYQEISDYIVSTFLSGEDIGDLSQASLVEDGILDSLNCLRLASWLEDRFDISIGADEVVDGNFGTMSAICDLIERKRDGTG